MQAEVSGATGAVQVARRERARKNHADAVAMPGLASAAESG